MSNSLPENFEQQIVAAAAPFAHVKPHQVLAGYEWPPIVDSMPTALTLSIVYWLAEHQTDPNATNRTPSLVFASFVRGVMTGIPARLEMIPLAEIDPERQFIKVYYRKQQRELNQNLLPADFPHTRLESLDRLIQTPAELNTKVPPVVLARRHQGELRLIDGKNRSILALMKGYPAIRAYVFDRDLELHIPDPVGSLLITRIKELLRGNVDWELK